MTQTLPNLPHLDVHALLKRHRLRPDPRLGQNFLVDDNALRSVVIAAEIGANETVLEIGPGLGSLTRYLTQLAKQVVAIEVDKRFLVPLGEVLAPYPNIRLVHGDILAFQPEQLFEGALPGQAGYLVVANIPYYITSALVRHLLEAPARPTRLVLTVQREVAERICAPAGELSLLALSVQVYGAARIAARIPASAFYPPPKVDSAVVRVEIDPIPKIDPDKMGIFFQLIKAGFSQKRKTLRNALAGGMRWTSSQAEAHLLLAGIQPGRRAQTLTLVEWSTLAEVTSSNHLTFHASSEVGDLSPPQNQQNPPQ